MYIRTDEEVFGMLMEGGNARYINRATGEVAGFADKMDLHKISRAELITEFTEVLKNIDAEFKQKTGMHLWADFSVITSGKAFNGSSSSLFNKDITDEEFTKHKPTVGDIDITFPGEYMGELWELLNYLEDRKLSKMVTYKGHKHSNLKSYESYSNLLQINAIFEIDTGDYRILAQIDFEASEYKDNQPTDWASFSHSSDWDDVKAGFKGVMHKYTLLNLSRASSKMDGIKGVSASQISKLSDVSSEEYAEILKNKDTKKIAKISTSKNFINATNLAFSVGKGLRTKFTQIFHNDGEPAIVDGEPVFFEKDSKTDTSYVTDLEKIFALIFHREPEGSDMKDFNSFVGVVKLMKKYSSKKVIEDFFINQLVSKTLFCPVGCQGLERNNPEGDFKIKGAMIEYLGDNFPYLKAYKKEIDAMIDTYYENYKLIDISENAQNLKPKKLSAIFESIENQSNLVPRGYAHWDESYLTNTKSDILKNTFGLTVREVAEFMRSASTSINRKKVFHDKSISVEMQRFLNFETHKENPNSTKSIINNILKRGY